MLDAMPSHSFTAHLMTLKIGPEGFTILMRLSSTDPYRMAAVRARTKASIWFGFALFCFIFPTVCTVHHSGREDIRISPRMSGSFYFIFL